MQGGDLHEALMDAHSGAQRASLLSWHRQGAKLALDIAKGLESLHARKVSNGTYACTDAHTENHILDTAKGLESLHARKVSSGIHARTEKHILTHIWLNVDSVIDACNGVCLSFAGPAAHT